MHVCIVGLLKLKLIIDETKNFAGSIKWKVQKLLAQSSGEQDGSS